MTHISTNQHQRYLIATCAFVTIVSFLVLQAAPANGQPEDFVVYRDNGTDNPTIFVYERTSSADLIYSGPVATGVGPINGDRLTVGDVNGDGLADANIVRPTINEPMKAFDPSNMSSTFTTQTDPGPVLTANYGVFPSAFNNGFSPTADTIFLSRDFNGNGLSDTIVARNDFDLMDGGVDFINWFALETTAPLDDADLGIDFSPGLPNVINGFSFGQPSVGDVPLVGDFNGDGIADRFFHRPNGSARQGFFDLSTGPGVFGDGAIDNPGGIPVFLTDATDDFAIADLNGDDFDDIVVIRNQFDIDPNNDFYTLFGIINNGDLTFGIDNNYIANIGTPSLGDSIHFGVFQSDAVPGDFNNDGTVNLADYTVWRDNLGAPESVLPPGTGNGNETVDADDYNLWKSEFGGGGALVASIQSSVPEPSSWMLLSLVGLAVLVAKRGFQV